jgi:tetratricopeptide (TPR) repeat protein
MAAKTRSHHPKCLSMLSQLSTHALMAAVLLAAPIVAIAQRTPPAAVILKPPISEPYRQRDDAARLPDDRRAMNLAFMDRYVVDRPDDPAGFAQRAFLLAGAGEGAAARADLRRALSIRTGDEFVARHVRWSAGWTRFLLDDPEGALELWQDAQRRHGGTPAWVPYTLAIGHWAAGDQAEALRWYDRAARDFPQQWGSAAGVGFATRNWGDRERSTVEAIFRAWVNEQRLRRTQVPA